MKNFYITTPIYYVNDKPHIGHAYTTILADVISRQYKFQKIDSIFLTGLDEHGQKVEQAAINNNINPQEHCDSMVPRFKELWDKLNIKYDDFIRTTENRHTSVVKKILQKVYDNGDIYFDEYEGLYSISEERFITEKEAESGIFKDIKKIKEKNYFFKMSAYQQKLIEHIKQNPDFILPDYRKNEVLGFLNKPLNDLCISRPKSRLKWGIELPFDEDYVTYVWFDALINYISSIGYSNSNEKFKKFWPANIHLIGKDILTTHCVYWPTMLMSIGLDLPKTIFAHGWWLNKDSKMSKSVGNVINPLDLIDEFDEDSLRFFLMRDMKLGQDSNFSEESFITRYNSDLANDLGNLLSRITNLINKFFGGKLSSGFDKSPNGKIVKAESSKLISFTNECFRKMKINEAIDNSMNCIKSINKYIESMAPWKLVKTDMSAASGVLLTSAEALRISCLSLIAVMPKKMNQALNILGDSSNDCNWGFFENGLTVKKHEPLFPRIDASIRNNHEKSHKKNHSDKIISYEKFSNIELKVAQIKQVVKIDNSDKLYKIIADIGKSQIQIVSGISKHYNQEDLVGKNIVVVTNLKGSKIFGIQSEGMLLAAKKGKKLSLITSNSDDLVLGEKIY